MATFEKLASKGNTRADMMKQIKDMDLDVKPGVSSGSDAGAVTKGDTVPKNGPNKYTVERKPGESLADHAARVKAARAKEGLD